MNLSQLSTADILGLVALIFLIVAGGIVVLILQQRRTKRLRTQFGGSEYDRAVTEGGNRRHAEAKLKQRADRVESLHLRGLTPTDRARFVASWVRVQEHFIDGPASAVTEADQLLQDVMSTRGYPVGDFEQRAADISVDHPLVMENYRAAHGIALRQMKGQASTEDLRQGMIHYRALFEDIVSEPKKLDMKAAS